MSMKEKEEVPLFSYNHSLDPFVDYMIDEGSPFENFRDSFSEELVNRYETWCLFYSQNRDYSTYDTVFDTAEKRAWFDREYIALYNEFRKLGYVFRIDMWW